MTQANSYRNYLLVVLMVILTFNYVDRLALGILLQGIKKDFSLSDTQLGLLSGIAFSFFYAIMGIPIARWVDRGNRSTIIALTTALWSMAVVLCGLVGNFYQLLLVRIGVAVGEAGCIPPAHSLIADYFNRYERPRAVSRYMLGTSIAMVISFVVSGWLNELYGWRVTFVVLGLPGLALAMLVLFTIKEPRINPGGARLEMPDSASHVIDAALPQPSLGEVCMVLWRNATFRHLVIGYSIGSFFAYGLSQWKAPFFMRSYGLQTGELGTWLAAIYGTGGLLGTYLGGELASRYAAGNERLQLYCIALVYAAFGVISTGIYLSSTAHLAFLLMALTITFITMTYGPLFAIIQSLVPAHMRGMSIALIYLFVNLIGLGLGPLAAGFLSDELRPWLGEESLRYALFALCPGYVWASWHFWRASKTVGRDLSAA